MDIADLAASAVKKITKGKGKRLAKKGYPEDLPKAQPVKISNKTDDKFDVGFAMKETMPDDFESKTYYIAGHKMAQKMTGFHDPITISAMWIGCGDEGGVMMGCAVGNEANPCQCFQARQSARRSMFAARIPMEDLIP